MAKEILTDDGQLEEVDMDEATSKNKELGLPAIDDEEGREDSEPDGEGGTKKGGDPKTKKSNASSKAEGKSKFNIQSSLDLLTIKALVNPAKVINKEAIPNHSIILIARLFLLFIFPSILLIYLKNLSSSKTICIKVK